MRQDILCQAKSGMGKTAVFVISILQNLEPKKGVVQALVLCHTRELSFQVGSDILITGSRWQKCMTEQGLRCGRVVCLVTLSCSDSPPAACHARQDSSLPHCFCCRFSAAGCPQICREFERFGKPLNVKVGNFFGGMDIKAQKDMLKDEDKCPDIVVGTPGRIKQVKPRAVLSLTQRSCVR